MATILIADDDAHIVRVMSIWLGRQGYETVSARNGQEALEVLSAHDIDLVLSDMNMPLLDGLGLTKEIRERGLCDVPIILLTARCDQENLATQLHEFGAQLAPKPFIPSQLVEQINELLGSTSKA